MNKLQTFSDDQARRRLVLGFTVTIRTGDFGGHRIQLRILNAMNNVARKLDEVVAEFSALSRY